MTSPPDAAFPSENRSNPRKKSSGRSFRRSILWLTSRLIPTLMLRWTISGKFSPRPSHTRISWPFHRHRPDCLPDDVLDLLSSLNEIKPVTIELGLQTIHEKTAAFIRRGYALPCFEEAVQKLRSCGISVVVHTILGLPGETEEDMLATIRYLNHQDIQGIKLQLLHVLKGTDLAAWYENPGLSRFYRGGIYRSCDPLHRRTFTGYHDSPSHRRRPQRASHCPALEQPEALSPQ